MHIKCFSIVVELLYHRSARKSTLELATLAKTVPILDARDG
jgi:hypothetical protein